MAAIDDAAERGPSRRTRAMDMGPTVQRTVRVLKSRSSVHDLNAHEFLLQADGARVL